jgi:hypothetical protein
MRYWQTSESVSAMAYKRAILPESPVPAGELSGALVGIGVNLAARAACEPNIEDTLYFASAEGMDGGDLRVLALVVTWFGVHGAFVNAERLTQIVSGSSSNRVKAFWASLARWQHKDRRFARLAKGFVGSRVDLLTSGAGYQVGRRGEDPRFEGTPLRVPAGVLRDRAEDVVPPESLAKKHTAYRFRVQMGPSYRADMWAALIEDPSLPAAALARKTYGSFATAWTTKRHFSMLAKG